MRPGLRPTGGNVSVAGRGYFLFFEVFFATFLVAAFAVFAFFAFLAMSSSEKNRLSERAHAVHRHAQR